MQSLRSGVNWCDVDGVSWGGLLDNEGLVFANLLLLGWDVDVLVGAVDDLVVNDVSEVLEGVELDLTVVVVDVERVLAGAASA